MNSLQTSLRMNACCKYDLTCEHLRMIPPSIKKTSDFICLYEFASNSKDIYNILPVRKLCTLNSISSSNSFSSIRNNSIYTLVGIISIHMHVRSNTIQVGSIRADDSYIFVVITSACGYYRLPPTIFARLSTISFNQSVLIRRKSKNVFNRLFM